MRLPGQLVSAVAQAEALNDMSYGGYSQEGQYSGVFGSQPVTGASPEAKGASAYVIDEWDGDDGAMQVNTAFQVDAYEMDEEVMAVGDKRRAE